MWWTKKKERSKDYDYSNRDKHHRFYNSTGWLKLRLYKLSLNPLCELCLPVLEPAVVVDHIKSLTDRYDLRLSLSNTQSLCSICHNKKSRAEQLEYIRRAQRLMIDDRMNELSDM